MKSVASSGLSLLVLFAGACGSGSTGNRNGSDAAAEQNPRTFTEQVALGQELYGEHCAECHGPAGQGTDEGPRVVGLDQGALPLEPPETAEHRTTRFVTVADVATFVATNMPGDAPGSLTTEQYFSILAFDLKANGIDLGEQKLDAAVAATLTIPRGQGDSGAGGAPVTDAAPTRTP